MPTVYPAQVKISTPSDCLYLIKIKHDQFNHKLYMIDDFARTPGIDIQKFDLINFIKNYLSIRNHNAMVKPAVVPF